MKNYIPRSKGDLEAVENLNKLPFEDIKEDVPELLKWLQDMNWPIARDVADYLLPHISKIQEEIAHILVSEDEMWIYWIIGSFITASSERPSDKVLTLISRLANNPTRWEQENYIDEVAKEAMIKFS
jgi:hypothetical protein